jgi:hypothetical protein
LLEKFSTRVAFNKAIGVCLQDLQEFGTPDPNTAELMVIDGCTVNGWTGEPTPISPDVRERHKRTYCGAKLEKETARSSSALTRAKRLMKGC